MKDINQETLFGEKVIASHEEYIDNEQVQVFVTLCEYDEYYNIYIINERYQTDSLNSLTLQEPVLCIDNPEEYFNDGYMIAKIMEYIICDRFSKYGTAEVSLNIKFEKY